MPVVVRAPAPSWLDSASTSSSVRCVRESETIAGYSLGLYVDPERESFVVVVRRSSEAQTCVGGLRIGRRRLWKE